MATTLTLLFLMSASRRTAGHTPEADATSALKLTQERLAAEADSSPRPGPRRHSPVCCCSLCEQAGTGEQAMRSVGGDYERFLASVASPVARAGSPTASPKPSRKPSRYGAFPMRRREPARVGNDRPLPRPCPSLAWLLASARCRRHTSLPTDLLGLADAGQLGDSAKRGAHLDFVE